MNTNFLIKLFPDIENVYGLNEDFEMICSADQEIP